MQNLSSVSPDLLRVFDRTASLGSMTKASHSLFITQPAVSRSISLLEERLGTALFLRTGKTLELTPEGRILFEATQKISTVLTDAQHRMDELRELKDGDIRIVLPYRLLHYFLLPHLKRFNQLYPHVRIHIEIENRKPVLHELVRSGRTDLILEAVHEVTAESEELEATALTRYRNCFAASRTVFGQLENRICTLSELNRFPLIVLRQGSDSRTFLEREFRKTGLSMNIGSECDTSAAVETLTSAGLGIGAFIRRADDPGISSDPDLFEVKLRPAFPAGHFVIYRNRSVPLSRAAQVFVSLIQAAEEKTSAV